MFFVKALGGSIVLVFGVSYALGFFDYNAVERAVETVKHAEAADNARADSAWGPQCNGLRDKLLGFENGEPVITDTPPESGIGAVVKINNAARELRKAGCDIDKAPGARSPFTPDSEQAPFREVESKMNGDQVDGSAWGGDPNAFNEGGADDWGQ